MVKNKHTIIDSETPLQSGKIIKPGNSTHSSIPDEQNQKAVPILSTNSSNGSSPVHHNSVKKNATTVIVSCIILGIIIIAGLIIGRNYYSKTANTKNINSSDSAVIHINANSKDDFVNVCNGNKISNATSYAKTPRLIALFEESEMNSETYYPADSYIKDTTWIAKDNEYNKINIVGCLKRQVEKYTSKTCEVIEKSGKKISLKLYTVDYQLILREAQSGKTLGTYEIDETDTTCPTNAYYTDTSEKFYSSPNKSKLTQLISPFINL